MAEMQSAYFIEGVVSSREGYVARIRRMPSYDEVGIYADRNPISFLGLKIPRRKNYMGSVFISKNNGTEVWEVGADRDNFSKLVDLIRQYAGTFHATIKERRV